MKLGSITVHMGWTIVVLLALLIGSLSVSWSSLPNIPNIVSIALGLSSLVLAMVAIVQALTGSNALLSSLTKIETAAQQAVTATSSVELAAQGLATKIGLIDEIPPSIHAIGKKLDDYSSLASQAAQAHGPLPVDGAKTQSAHTLLSMYKGGTNGTLIALYVAAKSSRSNKAFDPSDIFESKYIAGLVSGYLLALKFSGEISADYVNGSFSVSGFKTDNAESIFIAARADSSEFIARYVKAIDNFFDEEVTLNALSAEPAVSAG